MSYRPTAPPTEGEHERQDNPAGEREDPIREACEDADASHLGSALSRVPPRALRLEQVKDVLKGRRVTVPVFDDHVASGGPKQMANDERGHHHIIERTKDGNELGDEVDGRGDPARTAEEGGLGASRHA